MATQSNGRSPGRLIRGLALWVAGVGVWVAAPVAAQGPPPGDGPPALEVWQGNRRLDANRAPVRLITPPAPVSSALEGVTLPPVRTFEPTRASLPPAPPAVLPAVHPQAPTPAVPEGAKQEEIQQLIRTTRELTDECRSAIETCRATVEKTRQTEPEQPPIRLTPVVPPAEPAPRKEIEEPARSAPPPAAAEGPGWAQVGLLAGAVLACPVMVVLLAALFVRRTGIQFRVEVLNSGPMVARLESGWPIPPGAYAPGVPVNQPGDLAAEALAPVVAAPQEPAFTGEEFDLGPTYEEERLAKEEALRQQELALLQQVFEDNCRLHEELAALEPETAESGAGAEEDEPQDTE